LNTRPQRVSSPNRVVAGIAGTVAVIAGVLGLVVSLVSGAPFAAAEGALVARTFSMNPFGSLLAVAAGAGLLLCAARGRRPAIAANRVLGTVWLLVGYAALFAVGTPWNALALNGADAAALFAGAVLQLGVGLGARRDLADGLADRATGGEDRR